MWRGQVKIGGKHLPVHSAIAFFGGTYVIERPHLLPGCFFLTISWIMLASMTYRIQHPSPWHKTNTFMHYLSILVHGKSTDQQAVIEPSTTNHEEAVRYKANWEHRMKTDYDASWKEWELQMEMDRIGNEDLNTEHKKNAVDPISIALETLKPKLFPMQCRLRK